MKKKHRVVTVAGEDWHYAIRPPGPDGDLFVNVFRPGDKTVAACVRSSSILPPGESGVKPGHVRDWIRSNLLVSHVPGEKTRRRVSR